MATNVIKAHFGGASSTRTVSNYQYNYGQILQFDDLNLPEAYEVHFASREFGGEAYTQIGNADGVTIPDELFQVDALAIYAWVYLHATADDGETVYKVTIPLARRAKPTDLEPTPVQQDAITQAIAALQVAVEETGQSASEAAQSAEDAASSAADAEIAQQAAEAARDRAEQARDDAEESAVSAAGSAGSAEGSAIAAAQSATQAAGSAADAHRDADRAEQAAAESGYMYVYIDDDGYIVYERTPNTNIDLSIDEDGYICMEAIG